MTVLDALVVLVSSLSVFFDLKTRKIPNWLIALGLTSGVFLNGYQGAQPLYESVAGFVAGIAVLILPFALGWIGAGDVKLFAVVGALLGVSWMPRIFFYSALVAGLIALGYVVCGSSRLSSMKDMWADLKLGFLSLGHVMPTPVAVRTSGGGRSVPWGVAFAVGTIIAYYFDHTGQWAGF